MNKQEQRIIEAARNVLLDWTDGNMLADISGNFLELENAFNDYEKPSPIDFDWQSFRAEAAKDILTGIVAHADVSISSTDAYRLTKLALTYADELIKQLRGKEA